jgi:hypothetical protein
LAAFSSFSPLPILTVSGHGKRSKRNKRKYSALLLIISSLVRICFQVFLQSSNNRNFARFNREKSAEKPRLPRLRPVIADQTCKIEQACLFPAQNPAV